MTDQTNDLPDPSQRLVGTDNDHPLLRIDDDTIKVRDLILQVAAVQRDAILCAALATSRGADMRQRQKTPEVGDWVFEWMTTWQTGEGNAESRRLGFGIFLGKRMEWWHTDEDWKKEQESEYPNWSADERPSQEIWYVQYGPKAEDVARWENCEFYTLLLDRPSF